MALGRVDSTHRLATTPCSEADLVMSHEVASAFNHACDKTKEFRLEWLCVDSVHLASDQSAARAKTLSKAYRLAEHSFAYLDDLSVPPEGRSSHDLSSWIATTWFGQVLSLPALLLSPKLHFYDKNRTRWGDKGSTGLASTISAATAISTGALQSPGSLAGLYSAGLIDLFAKRLHSGDLKDSIFLLAELFNVSQLTPFIDAEGAFTHLQKDLAIEKLGDTLMLAWEDPNCTDERRGVFAVSPELFSNVAASPITPVASLAELGCCRLQSRLGLEVKASCLQTGDGATLLKVGKKPSSSGTEIGIAILIREIDGRYYRIPPYTLVEMTDVQVPTTRTLILQISFQDGRQQQQRHHHHHLHHPHIERHLSPESTHQFYDQEVGGATKQGKRPRRSSDPQCHRDTASLHSSLNDFRRELFPGGMQNVMRDAKRAKRSTDTMSDSTAGSRPITTNSQTLADPGLTFEPEIHGFMPTPLSECDDYDDKGADPWLTAAPIKPAPLQVGHDFLQVKAEIISGIEKGVTDVLHARHAQPSTTNYGNYLFACPFYVFNPKKHMDCLKQGGFPTIENVEKHLAAYHMATQYCPTCYQTFPTLEERSHHIRARTCEEVPGERIDIVTDEHIDALADESMAGLSDEDFWKAMYGVILKDAGVSPTNTCPYLMPSPTPPSGIHTTEERILMTRDYWLERGPEIVSSSLEKLGLLKWSDPAEERDLKVFHHMIEDEVLERAMHSTEPSRSDRE